MLSLCRLATVDPPRQLKLAQLAASDAVARALMQPAAATAC